MERAIRILMLEDNPMDAELNEEELRKHSIPFFSKRVDTKEGFLRELTAFEPDLILADYTLPSYDGLSALIATREQCPEAPFILVSGTIGEERAVETIKRGATDTF